MVRSGAAFTDVSLRHKRVRILRGPQDAEVLREVARSLVGGGAATEVALDLRSPGPGPDVPAGPGEVAALLHVYGSAASSDPDRALAGLAGLAGLADLGGEEHGILERIVFDRRERPGQWDWTEGWIRIGTQVRRPHLDRAGFVAHWGGMHAELVRAHHPGAVRYTQSYRLWSSPGATEFDGFYESYFPTEADWTDRLFDSAEGERLLSDDADGFLQESGSERLWVTKERFGLGWDEVLPA
ncbi:EthD domain-containing protein [Microbacterium sp. ASV81]|uniref:EthD domain-containing protein n=1 Tax=Microbacterium capsulatum TaxID=3041921 RepID=A0ABU0XJL1_9MICO|nr:EthD domain-containing protein [Microbacterium sp. ASV81]MDQ4215032.1 hypothetical protein [Microbacterium sp. ASV81]